MKTKRKRIVPLVLIVSSISILIVTLAIMMPEEMDLKWISSDKIVETTSIKSVYKIVAHPINNSQLFIAADNGIWEYDFSHNLWQHILETKNPIRNLVFDPINPDTIITLKTIEAQGQNWRKQCLLFGNYNGIWNWTEGYIFPTYWNLIIIDSLTKMKKDSQTIYVIPEYPEGNIGIYISKDSGKTFNFKPISPPAGTTEMKCEKFLQADNGTLYLAGKLTVGGFNNVPYLVTSTDNANTWQFSIPKPPPPFDSLFIDICNTLELDVKNNIIYSKCDKQGMFYASKDLGKTWEKIVIAGGGVATNIKVSPYYSDLIIVTQSTTNKLYFSQNLEFFTTYIGPDNVFVYDIIFSPDNSRIYLLASEDENEENQRLWSGDIQGLISAIEETKKPVLEIKPAKAWYGPKDLIDFQINAWTGNMNVNFTKLLIEESPEGKKYEYPLGGNDYPSLSITTNWYLQKPGSHQINATASMTNGKSLKANCSVTMSYFIIYHRDYTKFKKSYKKIPKF